MILEILAVLFTFFALSRVILRARDNKLDIAEFLFWTTLWVGFLIVVFLPDITSKVARIIGIGRGIDLIVYTSVALLFYLQFRLYVKLEEREQEITKLTREISFLKKK